MNYSRRKAMRVPKRPSLAAVAAFLMLLGGALTACSSDSADRAEQIGYSGAGEILPASTVEQALDDLAGRMTKLENNDALTVQLTDISQRLGVLEELLDNAAAGNGKLAPASAIDYTDADDALGASDVQQAVAALLARLETMEAESAAQRMIIDEQQERLATTESGLQATAAAIEPIACPQDMAALSDAVCVEIVARSPAAASSAFTKCLASERRPCTILEAQELCEASDFLGIELQFGDDPIEWVDEVGGVRTIGQNPVTTRDVLAVSFGGSNDCDKALLDETVDVALRPYRCCLDR